MIANILTVAGSDSGGGAGIQADIKTISALGAYAASAITALTAQNTRGVLSWQPVDAAFVAAQIDAVFDDIKIAAVKIGMLGTAANAAMVADRLAHHRARNIVLDPVMIAKSGDRLVSDEAIALLRTTLIPMARVVTPNLPEASVLLGRAVTKRGDMEAAARDLHRLGPEWVFLKGGHLDGPQSIDLLFDGGTPDRAVGAAGGDPQHPRDRLHAFVRDCSAAAAICATGGDAAGQDVSDRGIDRRRRTRRGDRAGARPSLPCASSAAEP